MVYDLACSEMILSTLGSGGGSEGLVFSPEIAVPLPKPEIRKHIILSSKKVETPRYQQTTVETIFQQKLPSHPTNTPNISPQKPYTTPTETHHHTETIDRAVGDSIAIEYETLVTKNIDFDFDQIAQEIQSKQQPRRPMSARKSLYHQAQNQGDQARQKRSYQKSRLKVRQNVEDLRESQYVKNHLILYLLWIAQIG